MDAGRLSEQFLEARDYRDLLSSAPYGRLSAWLEGEMADASRTLLEGQGRTHDADRDIILTARAYGAVLRHVKAQAATFDRKRDAADGAGIATHLTDDL